MIKEEESLKKRLMDSIESCRTQMQKLCLELQLPLFEVTKPFLHGLISVIVFFIISYEVHNKNLLTNFFTFVYGTISLDIVIVWLFIYELISVEWKRVLK